MDFLLRDQAPLSAQQWQALDATVTETARRELVGRRFIPVYGPLGAGVQAVPDDRFAGADEGAVDLLGNAENASVRLSVRRYLPIPIIYKDFVIPWRDLEQAQQSGTPLDTAAAAAAASGLARAEDNLIVNGNEALGLPGLRTVEGNQRLELGDWTEAGDAFNAAVRAMEALVRAGFYTSYTLLTGPVLYSYLNRMFDTSGVLIIEQVEKLLRGGVYQSPVVPDGVALVVANGAENVDLAIAMDVHVAYLTADNLNHLLRVLETAVLRIKRPASIAVLEGPGPTLTPASEPSTRGRHAG
jgi:uncharacterized linocin/CFP29 family protein